ncbi:Methyltransferase type 11 protein [Alteracholeplasma palmae J233]|uniref:Methyltransferase type 11 protein n=1 Tax=Alteracholeplasma palmae (strain ATCC 49389 / J233) TaxID=1318466 RepID=U4KRL8_ALTPJ|nr:class I SAM-dependent methyltransferase [Alteracholeplasma palmae]CCV64281.1 Methyltransferase type 11 protein [Alteracholeplasma palmae J233]
MFAYYYDQLMEDIDYESILEPIIPYLNKEDLILDAGCGTGHILNYLRNTGFLYAKGIDNDENMLSVAGKKINKEDVLYYHDLNEVLPMQFDKILMLFDVTNYFEDIEIIFSNIYQGLKDNGLFIFDIYKIEYLEIMKNYQEEDEYPFSYKWHTQSKNHILSHDFSTHNYKLEFKQYLYETSYYEKILKKLGFKFKKISGNDERKEYYICNK